MTTPVTGVARGARVAVARAARPAAGITAR